MTSGVIVGCTCHANQCPVPSGKKYNRPKATNRNGTITAPSRRVERNTRSSRMRPSTPARRAGQWTGGGAAALVRRGGRYCEAGGCRGGGKELPGGLELLRGGQPRCNEDSA